MRDDIPTITISIEEYMRLRDCEEKCNARVELTPKGKLTEIDVLELRHRYGEEVEYVVRDMLSGKGERWRKNK